MIPIMKYSILISFLFFLNFQLSFGQYLQENEWAKLSGYLASNHQSDFKSFLTKKGFSKADEPSEKYTFYTWKNADTFLYVIRVNKKSGQVTYMTNDQNYVLKLVSRFMSKYNLIKSETKEAKSTTHIFKSLDSTIAVKLDITSNSGTHLLTATLN